MLVAVAALLILQLGYTSCQTHVLANTKQCTHQSLDTEFLICNGTQVVLADTNVTAAVLVANGAALTIKGVNNETLAHGYAALHDMEDLNGRAVLNLGAWNRNQQLSIGMGSVLRLKDLVLSSVDLNTSSFNMVPSAFSLQPGSSLVMGDITVVSTCNTVIAYAAATCMLGVIPDYEVGLSWVYVKSWSTTTDEGATISATNVNVTCDTAAVISPCVSQAASSGQEVVQLTGELQQRRFNGTAVITLAGDISFEGLTNNVGALPAMEVSCYTLVLRADPAAPQPPAVDMGSKPGIIRIAKGNCPANGSNVILASSDETAVSAPSSLRMDGLVLHGLAPGPPSLYPYSLVTSMMWGVDTERTFGRANATNATASGLTTAAPSTLLHVSNCTIVVDAEEHWMLISLLATLDPFMNLQTNAPEMFAMLASEAQVSGLMSTFADPVTSYLRVAEVLFTAVRGLQGAWLWRNVTLHNALVPMSGRSLTVYGSPSTSASSQVLSITSGANGEEYTLLDTVDVIRQHNRLGPEHLASDRIVKRAGSRAFRLLLLNDTQVDTDSWAPSAVNLQGDADVVISGDPVDPGRVHLDLLGTACGITKTGDFFLTSYVRVNSLVLVNAGPLPASCITPPPISSDVVSHLDPAQRGALTNWTSALWFFTLPVREGTPFDLERTYPVVVKNVTLVLPDLEVRALVELANNGTTTLNIPPEVEQLLAARLNLSTAPQARQLPSPPGALEYYFDALFHIHYMGYGVTLRPCSAYQAASGQQQPVGEGAPMLMYNASSQLLLTLPGGPTFKQYTGSPASSSTPPTPSPESSSSSRTGSSASGASPASVVGGMVGGAAGGCVAIAALALLLWRRQRRRQYIAKPDDNALGWVERGGVDDKSIMHRAADVVSGTGLQSGGYVSGAVVAPIRSAAWAGEADGSDHLSRVLDGGPNPGSSKLPAPYTGTGSGNATGSGNGNNSAAGVNSTATHSGSLGAQGAPSSGSCFNVWLAFPENVVSGGSGRQTRRSAIGCEEEPGRRTGMIFEGLHEAGALAASGQQAAGAQSDSAANPAGAEAALWEDARHTAASLLVGDDQTAAVEVEGVLGEGSYGIVLRGRWRGLQVAIKRMLFQRAHGLGQRPGTMEQRIMQEVAISASLVHANVVSTYGFHFGALLKPGSADVANKPDGAAPLAARDVQDWQLYLVQELCEEGSLYQALLSMRFMDPATQLPNMAQVVQISMDVFQGLSYLHSRRLVHADIKPDNILLTTTTVCQEGDKADPGRPTRLVAKVADFGLSVLVQDGLTHVSGMCHGTPLYVAPEVVHRGQASQASDIYAAGVVMWEMYHSRSAFGQVVALVRNGALSPDQIRDAPHVFSFTEHHVMVEFEELATCCMRHDMRERPTAEDCVRALRGMMFKLAERRAQP